MNEIRIRAMTQQDIPFVLQLEQELFSDAWSEKGLSDTLRYHADTNFTAEYNGAPAGYLLFMAAADEGELLRIGVSPTIWRSGVGQALILWMDQYALANEIAVVWLEVRAGNQAARALYEKNGFVLQGYRKNYYHAPQEDAAIMSKSYQKS